MKNKSGFTLIELIVVIGIITVVSIISVPLMGKWKAHHEYTGALQDVLLTLRQARTVAVEENETVLVSLDAGAGEWMAFVDDGGGDTTDALGIGADGILDDVAPDGVPDLAQNREWDEDEGERIIARGTLPDSVSITSGDDVLMFDTRGFPVDATGTLVDETITLTNDAGTSRNIKLYLSGHSMIQ